MKKIKNYSILILLTMGGCLYAQENPTTSGGEGSGLGGAVSYSIGQIVYTKNTGADGSLTQGVQQPFEISIIIGINKTSINLELAVYPNPTNNYLSLKTENNDGLNYQLLDLQGKIIKSKKVTSNTTSIDIEGLPTSTYFLKITKNNNEIKTFKIIKN